jgi:hypothetical protein
MSIIVTIDAKEMMERMAIRIVAMKVAMGVTHHHRRGFRLFFGHRRVPIQRRLLELPL